jgi:hypothetical protein
MAAKSTHHETPEGWEKVNPTVNRMAVPGGWLYEMYGQGVVFVPEPLTSAEMASLRLCQCQREPEPAD